MTADQYLDQLYASLPEVHCQGKCGWQICGPILAFPIEIARMEKTSGHPLTCSVRDGTATCGYFDRINGRCTCATGSPSTSLVSARVAWSTLSRSTSNGGESVKLKRDMTWLAPGTYGGLLPSKKHVIHIDVPEAQAQLRGGLFATEDPQRFASNALKDLVTVVGVLKIAHLRGFR